MRFGGHVVQHRPFGVPMIGRSPTWRAPRYGPICWGTGGGGNLGGGPAGGGRRPPLRRATTMGLLGSLWAVACGRLICM